MLEDLAEEGHKLPARILDWRQLSKLKSTYADALPGFVNPRTHRVHTSYALASTTTGRLSSSEPNLQNIPVRNEEGRKIRRAFVADKGRKLISADYSQIELRLLAHIADIPSLKKAFADGLDIHAMTASEMFGVPIKDMPSEVRRRAKAINFGIIYGISAFGLANQLGIPREEAGAYIRKYFERFPGIRDYMDATKKQGARGRLCQHASSAANAISRASTPPIRRSARSTSARRSTRRSRARPPTSSAARWRAWTRRSRAQTLRATCCCRCTTNSCSRRPTTKSRPTIALVTKVMVEAPAPAVRLERAAAGRRAGGSQLGRGALTQRQPTADGGVQRKRATSAQGARAKVPTAVIR